MPVPFSLHLPPLRLFLPPSLAALLSVYLLCLSHIETRADTSAPTRLQEIGLGCGPGRIWPRVSVTEDGRMSVFFLSLSPLDNILSNSLPLLGWVNALCCSLINPGLFMSRNPYS